MMMIGILLFAVCMVTAIASWTRLMKLYDAEPDRVGIPWWWSNIHIITAYCQSRKNRALPLDRAVHRLLMSLLGMIVIFTVMMALT